MVVRDIRTNVRYRGGDQVRPIGRLPIAQARSAREEQAKMRALPQRVSLAKAGRRFARADRLERVRFTMILSMLRTHDDQVHVVFVKVPSNFGKSALTAEPVVDDNKDGTYNVRFTARELPRNSRSLIPFLRCFLFRSRRCPSQLARCLESH